jgi:hypothetical protein
MSNRLEKFVKNNREDFDAFEPGPVVWHNIQQQLNNQPKKKGVYISMRVLRWSAAACIIAALGVGGFVFLNKEPKQVTANASKKDTLPDNGFVKKEQQIQTATDSNQIPSIQAGKIPLKQNLADNQTDKKTDVATEKQKNKNSNVQIDKELMAYEQSTHYFAQLIVNKQAELKGLEKSNPTLYKEFINDINELDMSYKSLKKQLPQTQDRSRLIKAMINNLQLQIELLNKQLIIVNQIESKQKATNYEQAI